MSGVGAPGPSNQEPHTHVDLEVGRLPVSSWVVWLVRARCPGRGVQPSGRRGQRAGEQSRARVTLSLPRGRSFPVVAACCRPVIDWTRPDRHRTADRERPPASGRLAVSPKAVCFQPGAPVGCTGKETQTGAPRAADRVMPRRAPSACVGPPSSRPPPTILAAGIGSSGRCSASAASAAPRWRVSISSDKWRTPSRPGRAVVGPSAREARPRNTVSCRHGRASLSGP